jgi:hypothetical protein
MSNSSEEEQERRYVPSNPQSQINRDDASYARRQSGCYIRGQRMRQRGRDARAILHQEAETEETIAK